jgi:hypothetical protein
MVIGRCKLALAFLLWSLTASAQTNIVERLSVDATDAPRNILHSTITIPVAPGPVTGPRDRSRTLPGSISRLAAENWNGNATWKICMHSTCRFPQA